jgi:hypothetical protein
MATKTITLLQDAFGDGVQSLPELAGVGTFTESGGKLVFNIPSGQNGDWWTSGRNSRAAAAKLGTIVNAQGEPDKFEKLRAECTFSSFSGNTNSELWFNLYKGDTDWYQFFINSGATLLYARRMVGAAVTTYSSVALPSYPFKVRLVWDILANTIEFQYDTIPTSGGWITLEAALDIGTFRPTHALFGGKNWSGLPVVDGTWDDLLVDADLWLDKIDQRGDKAARGVIEEGQQPLVTAGGPAYHSRPDGLGAGQRVPGPKDQAPGSIGPFPSGGFGDKNQLDDVLPGAGGSAPSRSPDGLTVGQRVPGSPAAPADETTRPGTSGGFSDVLTAAIQDVVGIGLEDDDLKGGGGFFDEVDVLLGVPPEFNPHSPTTDSEAHTHLDNERIYRAFLYDTNPARNPGEAWAEPTLNNFSGYARDGTHYTNGVQDGGPVQAPWSAEGASNNRSSRSDFPQRVLVVVSILEIVLYDLDNYPTTFDVWARFKLGNTSTSTEFHFFGRGQWSIRNVFMKNGVLYASTQHTGWENGSLHTFDFKRDGDQEAGQLVRSDNHWKLSAGQDFTNRNVGNPWTTTGVSPSRRVTNEYLYEMAVHQDPDNPLRVWVTLAGEDNFDVIELVDNEPQFDYVGVPTPTANVGDARSCAVDPSGMLWLAEDDKIWRNGFDYQGGVIVIPKKSGAVNVHAGGINGQARPDRYPVATLPDGILVRQLVATQNWIFAATDKGVYAVHKTSLEARLAYSVAGKGGVGVSEATTGGEAIPGDRELVQQTLAIWNAQKSSYLMIATNKRGGIAVVRLRDDIVVQSREWNTLQEPGAYFNVGFVE